MNKVKKYLVLFFAILFSALALLYYYDRTQPHVVGNLQKEWEEEQAIKNQLITDSRQFVSKYQLIKRSLNCTASQVEGLKDFSSTSVRVTFRELHGEVHGEDCGGDPRVSPRLFAVLLDRVTGEIFTDAHTGSSGTMEKFELDADEKHALTLSLPELKAKIISFFEEFNTAGTISKNDLSRFSSYYWVYMRRVPEDRNLDFLTQSTTTDFSKAWDKLGPCFGIPEGQCRE